MESSAPHDKAIHHAPSPQGPGIIAEDRGKILRAKGSECLSQNTWTHSVISCTKPAQDQSCHNFSMGWGGAQEFPPLAEELLVIDDFWERECQFYLGIHALRDYTNTLPRQSGVLFFESRQTWEGKWWRLQGRVRRQWI